MQDYANPNLNLSTFQFKYYFFLPIEYVKRGRLYTRVDW